MCHAACPPSDVRLANAQALTKISAFGNMLVMDEAESASKFDRNVNLENLGFQGNKLTRVPNLTNLQRLRALWLSDNQITRIEARSFRGADRLVLLDLGRNLITFVHPSAFAPLVAMRVPQAEFAPTFPDGTPYHDAFGAGRLHAVP